MFINSNHSLTIRYILGFCFVISSFNTYGQRQLDYEADDMVFDEKLGAGAKRLKGNVIVKDGKIKMYCDSAYVYENNNMDAYSRVRIEQPGAMTIYGDLLNYDGNTKMAVLRNNIRMQDKDVQLVTDVVYYDLGKSMAYYVTGGTLINKENTLTSQFGYYFPKTKEFYFKKNVVLTNPQYVMTCDTLRYNTGNKTAYFLGPTTIKSKENTIYCESGWYDTQKDISRFVKNASIISKGQRIKSDSLVYDKKLKFGKAYGNVEMLDTAESSTVTGRYAEYWEESGNSVVTGKAMMMQVYDTDTLFLHADTLKTGYEDFFVKQKKNKRRKDKKEEQKKAAQDTVKHRILLAYNHVKFYKSDFQGKCDSLVYTYRDSTMRLFGTPVLWSEENQLTGENVSILISGGKIRNLHIDNSAFIISEADSARYSQIKGKNMIGYFTDNKLSKIRVEGNGETVYYVTDKDEMIGVNKAQCSNILIYIKENKVDKVTFMNKPDATLFPMKDLNPKDLILKGFSWHGKKRPAKMEDIFVW